MRQSERKETEGRSGFPTDDAAAVVTKRAMLLA